MLSTWPIRSKLLAGLVLLLVIVGLLSWGGLHGLYSYRSLVRSLSRRVPELPLANRFSQDVSDLRIALSETQAPRELELSGADVSPFALHLVREEFRLKLDMAHGTLRQYRQQLEDNSEDDRIGDSRREWLTVKAIDESLARISQLREDEGWLLDEIRVGRLGTELEYLQGLAAELPNYLYENISEFKEHARHQYRTLLVLTWITSFFTVSMFALFVKLFYQWIFRPLRVLIKGSRRVAGGQFNYRIHLNTHDEMSELAGAMNDMTNRFQDIRDDLDRQVQERTKQVVRSEQLASVGFLAAGVAHEINNPLAAIAMCAESLEDRLGEAAPADDKEAALVRNYLQMIQTEAFRCKGITEKLLDFSRIGDVQRQDTDLQQLVQDVADMIRHMGKYEGKHLELAPGPAVIAPVNAQQIKQVVLNLVVNGLDALEPGGSVQISVDHRDGEAVLSFVDDGCGMTADVLEHLFEPFFTRRRGGQGTGLGLSIAYRIVADHDGSIEASSAGPGRGSRFRVRLPLVQNQKETNHRYQAA
ncbi:MAG TPA: HAMP domain-containing sensor histidine kinase [Pirellulales bacterium]|nr:HAMP domain-containing sensor histidine kinase [Pirellulales bacterium]